MQVRITIRGRQYTVRGDDNEEEVQQVARELDARLSEVASRTRSFDEYTIALLTALNLASELHRMRKQMQGRLGEIDREAASLAAMLESMLPVEGDESDDG
jgi:cell division protein ZapA